MGTLPEDWAGPGLFKRLQFVYLQGNVYLSGPLPAAWASPDAFPSLIEMCVAWVCIAAAWYWMPEVVAVAAWPVVIRYPTWLLSQSFCHSIRLLTAVLQEPALEQLDWNRAGGVGQRGRVSSAAKLVSRGSRLPICTATTADDAQCVSSTCCSGWHWHRLQPHLSFNSIACRVLYGNPTLCGEVPENLAPKVRPPAAVENTAQLCGTAPALRCCRRCSLHAAELQPSHASWASKTCTAPLPPHPPRSARTTTQNEMASSTRSTAASPTPPPCTARWTTHVSGCALGLLMSTVGQGGRGRYSCHATYA